MYNASHLISSYPKQDFKPDKRSYYHELLGVIDDKEFLTLDSPESLTMWTTSHNKPIHNLKSSNDPIRNFLTINGKTLVTVQKNSLKFWATKPFMMLKETPLEIFPHQIAFVDHGNHIVLSTHDQMMVLRVEEKLNVTRKYLVYQTKILEISEIPGSKYFVTVHNNSDISIWNVDGKNPYKKIRVHAYAKIAITKDLQNCFVAGYYQKLYFWRMKTEKLIWKKIFPTYINDIKIYKDDSTIFIGLARATIQAWNFKRKELVHIYDNEIIKYNMRISFVNNYEEIIGVIGNGCIFVWKVEDREKPKEIEGESLINIFSE